MLDKQSISIISKWLKKLNVKISNLSIKQYLVNHPNGKTFKALGDLLNKQGINHYILPLNELTIPQVLDCETDILLTSPKEKGVPRFKILNLKLNNKPANFLKEYGHVIVGMEKSHSIKESDYYWNKVYDNLAVIISLVAVVFASISIFQIFVENSLRNIHLLLIIKLIGLGMCASLLIKPLEKELKKVCSVLGKNSSCDTVNKNQISIGSLKLTYGDLGMIYFGITIAWILLYNTLSTALVFVFLANIPCIPFVFYSIYHQLFIKKAFCFFCSIIITIFFTEFLLLIINLEDGFYITPSIKDYSSAGIIALLIVSLYLLFIRTHEIENAYETATLQKNYLKFQPKIIDIFMYSDLPIELTPIHRTV